MDGNLKYSSQRAITGNFLPICNITEGPAPIIIEQEDAKRKKLCLYNDKFCCSDYSTIFE